MNVRVGNNNALFLNFDNVRVAEVSVADSTLDRDSDTTVVVNRVRAAEITAPLPETLWVVRQEDGWRVGTEKPAKPERRLHFPGGGAAAASRREWRIRYRTPPCGRACLTNC